MSEVTGDLIITAGSQDYITWQLLQDDGVTAIDLSAATKVELKMTNLDTGAAKNFATDDVPKKLFITDAANGKIQLRPAADDFPAAARYEFYIVFTDAIGGHPVPEDKRYEFRVIAG